ncbi:MAG: ribonuclease H-like domain-containing protein [Thermodesulfobacteriota bacterium]|nr:ribonuclease H-like domain-containing protein [Thermodesulfobacteriota bacterium]
MDLRDRLEALLESSADDRQKDEKHQKIEALRARIDRIIGHRPGIPDSQPKERSSDLDRVLSGNTIETEVGPVFITEYHYPSEYHHGIRRLDELLEAPTDRLSLFTKTPPDDNILLRDAIFIDTETTGLSGGTGTYAFLVGAGVFSEKGFTTYQYFMRDFHEEPGLLNRVSSLVGDKSWIITFNGKAFDLNLLATRFTLNRLSCPFTHLVHWDLLSTSRCIFRPRLGSCTLANIEREVMGFERSGDIPGFEIPAIYHRFIRNGDSEPLAQVFYHNRLDILSMVTLATLLLQGIHLEEFIPELTPWEFLGFGKVLADFDHIAACSIWQHGLSIEGNEQIEYCLKKELSRTAKQAGDFQEAVRLWQEMLSLPLPDPYVHEELAKYLEHKEKDCHNAFTLVEEALTLFGHVDTWRESLEYRRNRLRRKIKRREHR